MEGNKDHLDLAQLPKITQLLSPNGVFYLETVRFSAIVTKINRRNRSQSRVLMITSAAIFNLKDGRGCKVKRRIGVEKLLGVTYSRSSEEFVLHIEVENDYYYASSRKMEVVSVLTQGLTDRLVLVWEKQEESLSQWVTQKKDFKKNVIRHPPDSEAVNYPRRPGSDVGEEGSIADFERGRMMSRSGTNPVFEVRQVSTRRRMVMKEVTREPMSPSEVILLKHIQCPFIIRVHYVFQVPLLTTLVTDYQPGSSLREHLTRVRHLSEDQALQLASEVVIALGHLHGVSLVYGRLRPSNVILTVEGHAKLSDFASVQSMRDLHPHKVDETGRQYTPPECLQGSPWNSASDWWSFGIFLYEVLHGVTPFENPSDQYMYYAILQKDVTFSKAIPLSDSCKDLIKRLLCKDPRGRLGSAGPAEVQNHPFFAGVNWPAVLAVSSLSSTDAGRSPR